MYLFTLGSPLQCLRCQNPNEGLNLTDRCDEIQEIETCSDGKYTCANLTTRTIENNVTSERQRKGCLSKDECLALKETCDGILKKGRECEFSCCQEDWCNSDLNPDTALKCCDGPYANGGLGLNSSSTLNQSYMTSDCSNDQREVPCLNGTCLRFFRRFENQENVSVSVELRTCLSNSNCSEIMEFCKERYQQNGTEICQYRCCKNDLCNNTSRFKLTSFYNALVIMLILFHY